jgi:hypothetical protein
LVAVSSLLNKLAHLIIRVILHRSSCGIDLLPLEVVVWAKLHFLSWSFALATAILESLALIYIHVFHYRHHWISSILLGCLLLLPLDSLHQGKLAIIFGIKFVITLILFRLSFGLLLHHEVTHVSLFLFLVTATIHKFVNRLLVFLVNSCSRSLLLGLTLASFCLMTFTGCVSQSVLLFLSFIFAEFKYEVVEIGLPDLINVHLEQSVIFSPLFLHLLFNVNHSLFSKGENLHREKIIIFLCRDLTCLQNFLFFLFNLLLFLLGII